jgi:hypothetical protein
LSDLQVDSSADCQIDQLSDLTICRLSDLQVDSSADCQIDQFAGLQVGNSADRYIADLLSTAYRWCGEARQARVGPHSDWCYQPASTRALTARPLVRVAGLGRLHHPVHKLACGVTHGQHVFRPSLVCRDVVIPRDAVRNE